MLVEEREVYLDWLLANSIMIDITTSIEACRDPNDNMILELAVSGDAEYIVTGDADLLALNPFQGIPIMDSVNFLSALEAVAIDD